MRVLFWAGPSIASHGRKRTRQCSEFPFISTLIPFMEFHPHDPIISQRPHPLIPSHWEVALNIEMGGGGGSTNIQSIASWTSAANFFMGTKQNKTASLPKGENLLHLHWHKHTQRETYWSQERLGPLGLMSQPNPSGSTIGVTNSFIKQM